MKKPDIQPNLRVLDRWYPDWGIGKVSIVNKTTFLIHFEKPQKRKPFELRYDYPHAQFLEKATKKNLKKYASTKR